MGAANFYTQEGFDLWAADFSIPLYPTDEDGEEIPDSDPVDYLFDDEAYDEAAEKIEDANKNLRFFKLDLRAGYYAGTQIEIDDGEAPDDIYFKEYFSFEDYGVNRYILRRMVDAEKRRINEEILPAFKELGFDRYTVSARFSNGETWYSKVA